MASKRNQPMKGESSLFVAETSSDVEDKTSCDVSGGPGQDFEPLFYRPFDPGQNRIRPHRGHLDKDRLNRLERDWTVTSPMERLQKIDFFQAPNRERGRSAQRLFRGFCKGPKPCLKRTIPRSVVGGR